MAVSSSVLRISSTDAVWRVSSGPLAGLLVDKWFSKLAAISLALALIVKWISKLAAILFALAVEIGGDR